MQSFSIDADNDIFINNRGDIDIARDLQAVLSVCKSIAQTKLGECIYNINKGLDFDSIFQLQQGVNEFGQSLINALVAVNGVTRVGQPVIIVKNNALSYTVTITTIYGEGVIDNQFVLN